jgi:hypothetical protein
MKTLERAWSRRLRSRSNDEGEPADPWLDSALALAVPAVGHSVSVTTSSCEDPLAVKPRTTYGRDLRDVDYSLFVLWRDEDEFRVGEPCSSSGSCTPAPEGLVTLKDLLITVSQQLRANPVCVDLPRNSAHPSDR